MAGWIKLHRKILNNPVFLNPELYQLFSYCLLRANHNESKILWNGVEEKLDKGCFITGRKAIANDIGQNESSIYKRLKLLEKLNMISLKSNNKYSVVKVLNYCIYQGEELDKEQQSNNKVTTKEQQSNTDKNIKNVKNDKKINESNMNVVIPPSLEEVKAYCTERQNGVDAQKWHDFYSAKGWMVGKNKMKDWKAAVRTWERNTPQDKPKPDKKSKYDDVYL